MAMKVIQTTIKRQSLVLPTILSNLKQIVQVMSERRQTLIQQNDLNRILSFGYR